jgi:DNA-binding NarL/FixJ family response regulator
MVITKETNNHAYYIKILKNLGFSSVTATLLEKDALYFQITDLKPSYIFIDAWFYESCTPFMVGELKNRFPQINITAFSIGKYPIDLAMYFIVNGATSYVSTSDGFDKFLDSLAKIYKGKNFISPAIAERIALRNEYPAPAGKISKRQKHVLRLICSGFTDKEIADTMAVSRNTIVRHKTVMFTTLNVRNSVELIIVALTLKIVSLDELYFHPNDYTVNPVPDIDTGNKNKKKMKGLKATKKNNNKSGGFYDY